MPHHFLLITKCVVAASIQVDGPIKGPGVDRPVGAAMPVVSLHSGTKVRRPVKCDTCFEKFLRGLPVCGAEECTPLRCGRFTITMSARAARGSGRCCGCRRTTLRQRG